MFLPEEIESLDELLKETAVAFSADVVYLANLDTYDAFFDLVVKIKKKCVIKNSAAAFLKLLELARIGLEQMMKSGGRQRVPEHSGQVKVSWYDALLIHRAAENYQGVALMVRDPILDVHGRSLAQGEATAPRPPAPGPGGGPGSPLAENQDRFPGVGGTGPGGHLSGYGGLESFEG